MNGPQVWKDEKKNAHSPGFLERRICLGRRAWEGHRSAGNQGCAMGGRNTGAGEAH